MVGRLHQGRWQCRTTPGVQNAGSGPGLDSKTSQKACRGAFTTLESGPRNASFDHHPRGFRETAVCSQCLPGAETLNPGSLSPHLGQPHFARSRCSSPLRYRDAGPAAVHTAEIRHWPELGLCRSLSAFSVEYVFDGVEMELLLVRKYYLPSCTVCVEWGL